MPANPPSYQREYMRLYRQSGRERRSRLNRNLTRPFVGVDGEGGTLDNGYHAYFLLSAGDSSVLPSAGNTRLTSWECLDFLADLDPEPIYVAYYFDYDVAKILEDLPWSKLDRLIHRHKRTGIDGRVFPVDFREFQVDYLPRKFFRVRRKTEDDWTKWIEISDVGTFFQCSFLKALDIWKIGRQEELEIIESGKVRRDTFSFKEIEQIREYNLLEIRLLAALMEEFRRACHNTGYVPTKWQGPGLLAEAMFKAHGVKKSSAISLFADPEKVGLLQFAANAFYGGRPEITVVGPVNRPVYQWDINSAYPHSMRYLPCLEHGQWSYHPNGTAISSTLPQGHLGETYGLHFGTFRAKDTKKLPVVFGLPIRTEKGSILYPAEGKGWYWSFEIAAAIHQEFVSEESWTYRRTCHCQPLGFVEDVYEERKKLGKNGPGNVLKLGLNSLYGKMVQSIGVPKYSNPIWGSFITAYCRTMIQQFIHSSPHCRNNLHCGKDILMIATDSVCTFTERKDMVDSEKLGGWSVEEHSGGMFIVQPGLYFGTSGKPTKTRGVPRSIVDEREGEFRDAYNRMVESRVISDGNVSVPQRLFVGIRYALHRHNLKLLGQWIDFKDPETGETGKTISFDWTTKRAIWPVVPPAPGVHDYIETFAKMGDTAICTVPYSKDIGGLKVREELRLAFEDQPDYIDGSFAE